MKLFENLKGAVENNPGAMIRFLVSEDNCNFHDYSSVYIPGFDSAVYVEDLTEYSGKLLEYDDVFEEMCCDLSYEDLGLSSEIEFENLSDKDFEIMVAEKIDKEYKFETNIIIRIG